MQNKITKITKKQKHWLVEINNNKYFYIIKSNRKNKKYDVYGFNNDKFKYLLSFGHSLYQHYKDILGGYKNLNHNDEERKERYYKRFGDTNDIYSAKWWSHRILW